MGAIEIIIQGDVLSEARATHASPTETVASVLGQLEPPIVLSEEIFAFVEDVHAPVEPESAIEEHLPLCSDEEADAALLRLYVGKCRRVEVSVRFNGECVERSFAPGVSMARVHHWATRRAFGLSKRDAAEHVLQQSGTNDWPDRDVHVGTLADECCSATFDLVPRRRVEG